MFIGYRKVLIWYPVRVTIAALMFYLDVRKVTKTELNISACSTFIEVHALFIPALLT